jgi:hypothetical protein
VYVYIYIYMCVCIYIYMYIYVAYFFFLMKLWFELRTLHFKVGALLLELHVHSYFGMVILEVGVLQTIWAGFEL